MSSVSSSQASSTTGCGKVSPVGELNGLTVLDGAGQTRSFDITVPTYYSNTTASSLVFDLHGAGGLSAFAKSDGFQYWISVNSDQAIAVFPQGIPWLNYGVGWNEMCNEYDMVFFDKMLKYLSENYCVNLDRVFVTGFSWGGDMTNALACCRGDKIKGIAPISGPELMNSSCPATKKPNTWMRYGSSDGAYTQQQFTAQKNFYIQKLQCANTPTALANDPECVTYGSCDAPLTVCTRPIGHQGVSYPESQQLWNYWRSLP